MEWILSKINISIFLGFCWISYGFYRCCPLEIVFPAESVLVMSMKLWKLDDICIQLIFIFSNLIRLRQDYVKLMKFEFQYLLSLKLSHGFSHKHKLYDMIGKELWETFKWRRFRILFPIWTVSFDSLVYIIY